MLLTEEIVFTKSKEKNVLAVTDLNIWGFELTNVDVLCKMQNLQKLILTKNCLTTLKPFSSLVNLKELYMRLNNIPDLDELKYIKHLSLEVLALSDNPCCQRAGPKYRSIVLCALPNLRVLDNQTVTEQEKKRALVGEVYGISEQKPELSQPSLKKEGNKTEKPIQQPKQNQYQSPTRNKMLSQPSLKKEGNKTEKPVQQPKQNQYQPPTHSERRIENREEPMPGPSRNCLKVQQPTAIQATTKKTIRSGNLIKNTEEVRPGPSPNCVKHQQKISTQPKLKRTPRDNKEPPISFSRTELQRGAGDTYHRNNKCQQSTSKRRSVSSPRRLIEDHRQENPTVQTAPTVKRSPQPQFRLMRDRRPPVSNIARAALTLVRELDRPALRLLKNAIRVRMDDIRRGFPTNLY